MKKIDGRKAEITRAGQVYDNWVTLATEYGYPRAAFKYGDDSRSHLINGDTVTLLTSTFVHDGAMIWVVQARNGEQFLYSEKGLRIFSENITVLPDESLGGILREYREVKRKANVGELVKVVGHCFTHGNGVFTVDRAKDGQISYKVGRDSGYGTPYYNGSAYRVLEPTEIIRINSERFRMVDRKAAVGERVIVTAIEWKFRPDETLAVGQVGTCKRLDGKDGSIITTLTHDTDGFLNTERLKYAVLELVVREAESATPAPLLSAKPAAPLSSRSMTEQAAENVSSLLSLNSTLTLKVAELESAIRRMNSQLRVAREDIVLIEEGVSDDIKSLESRVATLEEARKPKPFVSVIIPEIKAKSPQQLRDEIVERAKDDVERLKSTYGKYDVKDPESMFPWSCVADVKVDRKKRKVTVVLRGYESGDVYAVGRAKCAPGEVFNAHLGISIALHRARGIEVPAEYLTVPQPTEVRVGDVVKSANDQRNYTVSAEFTPRGDHLSVRYVTRHIEEFTITEDSREEAESSASSAQKGAAA